MLFFAVCASRKVVTPWQQQSNQGLFETHEFRVIQFPKDSGKIPKDLSVGVSKKTTKTKSTKQN